MRKEYVGEFVTGLKAGGIDFAAGLPDSWLKNVIEALQGEKTVDYVPVCNEGVGFSTCVGAWMGGKRPVLLMENSGLRVAAESIARLNMHSGAGMYGVATLIVTSYRGDIGDTELWAVPHGITCEPMLDALRVPYMVVREAANIQTKINRCIRSAFQFVSPVALVVSGDLVMED